jgi:hypothetical protein
LKRTRVARHWYLKLKGKKGDAKIWYGIIEKIMKFEIRAPKIISFPAMTSTELYAILPEKYKKL